MKQLLWLDDVRNPYKGTWLNTFAPDYQINNVVTWVKSFNEFKEWIEKNGLPDMICFDHDLGEDLDKGLIKKEAPSGFHCVKWLVDYCLDRNLDFPMYNIQSANPVGADNINSMIQSYRKFRL